jgi:hypothetical protein
MLFLEMGPVFFFIQTRAPHHADETFRQRGKILLLLKADRFNVCEILKYSETICESDL